MVFLLLFYLHRNKRGDKKTVHIRDGSYDIRLPESSFFEALASHIVPLSRDQAPQRLLARLPHPFRMTPDAEIILACLKVQCKPEKAC
jgi:hypothetical protein